MAEQTEQEPIDLRQTGWHWRMWATFQRLMLAVVLGAVVLLLLMWIFLT